MPSNQLPAHRVRSLGGLLAPLAIATLSALLAPAAAAPFTVATGATDNSAKTLGTGAGQTGTIAANGTLSVSGSTVAVTVSGNNATLTNDGTIKQTGSGRAIRDNTGVTGLTVNNGSSTNSSALIQTADADVVQMNKSPASVTLNNYGTMASLNASKGGAQAVDFNAIATGSNIVNNYATGVLQAQDADAVRPGVNGIVNNYGVIRATNTTDTGDDGIDAQTNTGVAVHNYNTGSITGARHGITGGAASNSVNFTTGITNDAGGTIAGNDGSGINLDGFNALQTATIANAGTITGNGITGDGDGIDVDGVLNLTNSGTIRSVNAYASSGTAYSEGVTFGGGTISNSGLIEGQVAPGNSTAVGRGITLAGNDITSGALAGTREAIYANASITNLNHGVIRGQTDSAIVVEGAASGYTVSIDNQAGGLIQGGGSSNAAIKTGADTTIITNAGVIDGSGSGKAIQGGAGNLAVTIQGGAAAVRGDIIGGSGTNTLTYDLGAKTNTFTLGGNVAGFSTVEVKSGTVDIANATRMTLTDAASQLIVDSGATLHFDLGGAGQIILENGQLNLQSSSELSVTLGFSPTIGQSFTLVDILGSGAINGSFSGLSEGSVFSVDGTQFSLSYTGGNGNDLTLTAIPEPATYALTIGCATLGAGIWRRYRRQRSGQATTG